MPKPATSKERKGARSTGGLSAAADAEAELDALRRTRQLLAEQVAQVDGALVQLADSDALVSSLGADLDGCGAEVSRGARLVSRLRTAEARDDLLLYASWAVWALVVAYVWGRRLFGLFPDYV